ncbi:MAG TPA: methyltransferase domain-containing protein [Casimicrobiaceae bacterium]|nr:methyltransferase domain-containing protein [Casimicrobiaceae bacterium]
MRAGARSEHPRGGAHARCTSTSGRVDFQPVGCNIPVKQTPVHEQHNPDLLALMPTDSRRLVEVGCSSGALAREFKSINPNCHYTGIEIDPEYAQLSRRHCDVAVNASIEDLSDASFNELLPVDCWIFGDTLEHLRDPWSILSKIRSGATDGTSIVACIPNSQHWSLQARLNCGGLRYEDAGLLDRTHLRFFTRTTIIEMFHSTGFTIAEGKSRVFEGPTQAIVEAIRAMAKAIGADPNEAANDALPFQYVIRAVPT